MTNTQLQSITTTQKSTDFTSGVLQRKCACGNHTMAGGECEECKKNKLMGKVGLPLQTKLTISQPGDQYEQEADRVAEQVMRMPSGRISSVSQSPVHIQRMCAACASGKGLCPKCAEEKKQQLQRKEANGSEAAKTPATVHEVIGSSGQPLDAATRDFMEPRFGQDFSHVRVHTNAQAAESAYATNALAYTVGSNVVFGAGQYAPRSSAGQKLLAHELSHVIQQGTQSRATPQTKLTIGAASDASEVEADRVAEAVTSSNAVPQPLLHATPANNTIQRTIGDGHDLSSPRFSGDERLEACYDDESRLTKGDRGESVEKVQQALIELGYDLGSSGADGIYGNYTWNAVKQFKADQALGWEWMGDVGPGTMQRLDELFSGSEPPHPGVIDLTCPYFQDIPELGAVASGERVIQKGDSGEEVRQVQQVLLLLGYPLPQYGVDAQFGGETKSAVLDFQSDQVMNLSGVIDSESLGLLDGYCGAGLPLPTDTLAQKVKEFNEIRLNNLRLGMSYLETLEISLVEFDIEITKKLHDHTLKAIETWLKAKITDPDFISTVSKARSLLKNNYDANSNIGVPPESDAICSISPCAIYGFGCTNSRGVNICQGWQNMGFNCKVDVLLHEFNHFIGMGGEDGASLSKPDDAFKNAHYMASFVAELNFRSANCCRSTC